MYTTYPAILALEDGTFFEGESLQSDGYVCGEVVFNTATTGYQEILTDCSYSGQMVTFTYPHIGNVGVNSEDIESNRVWPVGIILRSLSGFASNWRSKTTLPDYLLENRCFVIGNLDTRALTRKIRMHGAFKGCIMVGKNDPQTAIHLAQKFVDLETKDLSIASSTSKQYEWTEGLWGNQETSHRTFIKSKPHVIVYDFGVKQSILRCLVDLGCRVTVVPVAMSVIEMLALSPDGILLSNGPGDPKLCISAIQIIQRLLLQDIPILGICLGHQLLTLALGGNTVKMKFGHHGVNHPVQELESQRVWITSQNHSFMLDETSLPPEIEITHRSLFDKTPQGFRHRTKAVWGFQGHPEANPGPIDAKSIFTDFMEAIQLFKRTKETSRDCVYA